MTSSRRRHPSDDDPRTGRARLPAAIDPETPVPSQLIALADGVMADPDRAREARRLAWTVIAGGVLLTLVIVAGLVGLAFGLAGGHGLLATGGGVLAGGGGFGIGCGVQRLRRRARRRAAGPSDDEPDADADADPDPDDAG